MTFTAVDWAIVAAYFAISLAIGLYYSKRAGQDVGQRAGLGSLRHQVGVQPGARVFGQGQADQLGMGLGTVLEKARPDEPVGHQPPQLLHHINCGDQRAPSRRRGPPAAERPGQLQAFLAA